jgi:hypothetical protein
MIMNCGAVGGMRIGRGNRSTQKKLAPVPRCPPQIQHDLAWARTRAAAVGSRRLTAWAMARPLVTGLKIEQPNHEQNFVSNEFDLNSICLRKFISRVSSFHQRQCNCKLWWSSKLISVLLYLSIPLHLHCSFVRTDSTATNPAGSCNRNTHNMQI